MLPVTFVRGSRLSQKDEDFLSGVWSNLPGEGQSMANAGGVAIVARDGSTTVGVVKGWYAGGVGYVTELVVQEDRRNQGIGRRLLSEFEAVCADSGSRRLALRVQAGSRAQSLYERLGWHVELSVEDWLDGHTYVQMRKDL